MARRLLLAASLACLAMACGSSDAPGDAPAGNDGGSVESGASPFDAAGAGDGGPGCGFEGRGTPLHVAGGIELCMPPVVCTAETCPPALGRCVGGACVFDTGYAGVATLRQAWATHYCALATGGCHGVTQLQYPEDTARAIATQMGIPLCDGASPASGPCVGIAASSPMVVGNSQLAVDPVTGKMVSAWGLGLTEASGLCYAVTGPGGSAIVALTDRCGGYCKCKGSGFQECGPCVNAPDMLTSCPCVGTAPPAYGDCCGLGCPTVQQTCDWCASNNHPHFDLDDATFAWVCGAQASRGSCQLTEAKYVPCLAPAAWPPGGGGAACGASSFACAAPAAHQDAVPGTGCCCNYDQCPKSEGSCGPPTGACKTGSCACGAGMPDANHPQVPSTGCCCVYGASPQADGSCQ